MGSYSLFMRTYLGIDIGTSGVKVLVADQGGAILGSATQGYPLLQPRAGWTEQNPVDWWEACIRALSKLAENSGVDLSAAEAIGLSGQMHGSVVLGKETSTQRGQCEPLCPAILWNDQRTSQECEHITQLAGGVRALVEQSGNPALTGYTLPKLLWLKQHAPEVWNHAATFMLPKDYIAYRLTGERASDVGDASGTMMLDIDQRIWDASVCNLHGISLDQLPKLHESSAIVGHLLSSIASYTGLRSGIPIIIGSGDNMIGAIGAGVVQPGEVVASLGTSGVIYAPCNRPSRDLPSRESGLPPGRVSAMCGANGSQSWCNTGCMLAAGLSLRWLRDVMFSGLEYEAIISEAQIAFERRTTSQLSDESDDGVYFLPHLTGERCPYPDPNSTGAFVGLTSRHTRGDLALAVLEGVTYSMAMMLDIVRSVGQPLCKVRLSGAGNRSLFWRQLQADIYACPVETTNTEEGGCALGAAILAMVGTGVYTDVAQACNVCVRVVERLEPHTHHQNLHELRKGKFAKLYPMLRDFARA